METIFNVNSFTISKLNKLRKYMEKYQIEKIHNNLKNEDEIKIVYNKERIKLNEKNYFKVNLIRNRHYRQLENIIKLSTHRGQLEIRIANDLKSINLDKNIFNSNKDILKMYLINYIGLYNFDNIFELSKEEMLELKDYKHLNNTSDYITRLMGAYIPEKGKEKVLRYLESKVKEDTLYEMKACRNFILICPEIIQEFCVEYFKSFSECKVNDIFELYTIIFNLVLVHEIGHAVFEYTFDLFDGDDERRANYFASLTFDGTFDKIIKVKTDIQKGLYKNPILITADEEIKTIKEKIYNI